jgi:hypothetical protein
MGNKETLNLDKLESQLDNALAKETKESLTNWLDSKRNKETHKRFKHLTTEEITELVFSKKQEKLEEAAERILFENTKNVEIRYRGGRDSVIKSMLDIAKWQQEQENNKYSEEDMIAFGKFAKNYQSSKSVEKAFEQFKKK